MTRAQWHRARELFEHAIDLTPGEVAPWLAGQEADPLVVAEVRSLLEHHTSAGHFLDEAVTTRVVDLLKEDAGFEPGAVIGSYVIEKEIGRGGMGQVYLATDSRLGRQVALKVVTPRFVQDAGQRDRLRKEARAAASLNHPGICTIYALEEIDGHVAIAAEYIDGHPLRAEIAGGQRPTARELLDTARQLTAALAAAHSRGITHRDLKPENVMRTRTGQLKILDFGLALIEPQDGSASPTRDTTAGTLVGTLLYMAPEQIEGRTIDVRTDLFALGVLLYEFATGINPFAADSAVAVAGRILESQPKPLGLVRSDTPRQLAAAIERCLRKKPGERFASAGDLLQAIAADDLRAWDSGGIVWWRNHLISIIALYFAAAAAAWLVKEWFHGVADALFVVVALAAAVGGVFRGHLLFTERTYDRPRVLAELRRAGGVLTTVDLTIALALVSEGVWATGGRPVGGVLIAALGIGFAVARWWIERNTTEAAFGGERGHADTGPS